MQSNVLFRVVRGLTVVVAIVVTHVVIVWLFNTMKIPMPDLGPVFATIMVDENEAADGDAKREDQRTPDSPRPPAEPATAPTRLTPPADSTR